MRDLFIVPSAAKNYEFGLRYAANRGYTPLPHEPKVKFHTIVEKPLADHIPLTCPSPHKKRHSLERHVVLVAPEIHWNTGNIGRTCVATNACLHLIRPLGFSLESREVKRAGLDYWENVKLTLWDCFNDFLLKMAPQSGEVALFSKRGSRSFWTMPCPRRLFLVFGSETRGLPDSILRKYIDATYHIPITSGIRSLNLSTAVGIALFESLRASEPFHGWPAKPPA